MTSLLRSARAVTTSRTCCSNPSSLSRSSRVPGAPRACRDVRARYTRDEEPRTETDVPPAHRVGSPEFAKTSLSSDRDFDAFRSAGSSWQGSAMDLNSDLLEQAKDYWNRIEDKPAFVAITIGSVLLAWIGSYTISAVERIPLVPKVLEFVGLVYSSTFFYKYVLFADGRAQLQRDADALFKKMTTAAESAIESAAESASESAAGIADDGKEMTDSIKNASSASKSMNADSSDTSGSDSDEQNEGNAGKMKGQSNKSAADEAMLHLAEGVGEGHTSTTADMSAQRQDVTQAPWDDGTDYAGAAMRDSGDDFDENGSPAELSPELLQEALGADEKGKRDSQQEMRKQKGKDQTKDWRN